MKLNTASEGEDQVSGLHHHGSGLLDSLLNLRGGLADYDKYLVLMLFGACVFAIVRFVATAIVCRVTEV